MLNLSREQAARIFYSLIAVLVLLCLLLILIFAMIETPAAQPLVVAPLLPIRVGLYGII